MGIANANPGEDEEFENEMTINDDIDPDDLIRTMDPIQIDKFIPKKKFDKLVKEHPTINEDTCTICIDYLKNGEMLRVIPLCQHVFHADCLLNWLLVNEICPNCKNEVSIFTLRAYFESIRASKGKMSPNKEPKKADDQNLSLRQVPMPGVTHSRLQPRTSTLTTNTQQVHPPADRGRIRIEEQIHEQPEEVNVNVQNAPAPVPAPNPQASQRRSIRRRSSARTNQH